MPYAVTRSRAARCRGAAVAAVLATTLLAACGAQVDPEAVASANARLSQQPGAQGTVGPDGRTTAATSPGRTSGVPGADDTSGTGPGTDPGDQDGQDGQDSRIGQQPGSTTSSGSTDSAPPPGSGIHAASCAGFHDQTGVTDSTITLANASDISGPIPGIFQGDQLAVQAYADYFNSTSSICGRKLKVESLDTRTDAEGDQQAYTTACSNAFAAVGSMAAFDSGGAATAQQCGIPDLRSGFVNSARIACTTCFAAQSGTPNTSADAVPDYFVKTYGDAAKHAGYIYINAGPALENARDEMKAWTPRGFRFVYSAGIDVSAFNYVPYAEALKEHGVQIVRFLGAVDEAVRLRKAMTQVDYHPEVFLTDATAYDDDYVSQGGSDVDGTTIFVDFTPFDEASHNPELANYLRWLQEVKPGAVPTYDGLFAWSAAHLFTDEALQLGGKLTRSSMVAALRGTNGWTDHGLHPPQSVGRKVVGPCWRFLKLDGTHWEPLGGTGYHCGPVLTVH